MKIKTHEDLEVYQIAFKAAMEIFELSKKFPVEEKYSLTDQIRRSSLQYALILLKLGAREGIKQHSLPNLVIQKLRQQRCKYGSNLLLNVVI